jgi:hypothetical protein
MVRPTSAIAVLSTVLLASASTNALGKAQQCEKKGNKQQVFIKPNTPLYRGPGINYPVAGFLERGKCAPFSEVSMDRQWVLVDLGEKLAWVERGTLATASQELIAKVGPGDAPIGSGQKRSYVEAKQQVSLMDRPSQSAEPKSVLPAGTRLLPLMITKNGKWVQVRDERSEIGWVGVNQVKGSGLEDLPIADEMADAEPAPKTKDSPAIEVKEDEGPAPPVVAEEEIEAPPPGPKEDGGIGIFAAAFGAALNPIHSLDSNSPNGYRTYEVSSFSGGAAVEIGVSDLGPIALRAGYQFAAVTGVSPENKPNVGVSGFMHDAQLRVGLPLVVGPLLITPELGYQFGMFDFEPQLPGTPALILSTISHTGTAGGRFQFFATSSLLLELDGAFVFGITSEGPSRLGDAGFTMGFLGAAGAQILITEMISVLVRYHASFRSTPYTGPAQFDRSIGEATLTDVSHGALVGVGFTIGG